MAPRTVYGHTHSENGWPMVDQGSCEWVRIPGAEHVSLQIQKGQPLVLLRAFAADFHAHVEPLRDADSACWTATNSVSTSNHLSGTAMDLNWNGADGKTFRFQIPEDRAYPPPKNQRVRELLDFYEGTIYCGGFWDIRDWMHFQVGYGTFNDPRTQDFIARKIRPDGFSTFKRGSHTGPDAADVLARATGVTIGKAREILPAVRDGLIQSDCTTVPRIAMWLSQCGHESAHFEATEEYEDGDETQERWKYKGRTWIQLTWRSAYEGFGKWCHARGLVTDPMVFVNNPRSLADLKWAGLGAAYYWTTTRRETRKYPTLNEASDARDVLVATQIINGGTNGLTDRQNRYNRATAVGDQLLALIGEDDDMFTDEDRRRLNWLYENSTKDHPSRSKYKAEGEGPKANTTGFLLSVDAMCHEMLIERAAMAGNEEALALVKREADKGDKWSKIVYDYCTEPL